MRQFDILLCYSPDVTYKVSVVGATGVAGGQILRILLQHEQVEISNLVANSSAGTLLSEHHPGLIELADRKIESLAVDELVKSDVVFLALPHAKSGAVTHELEAQGFNGLIVDVGADHRLESEADWVKFYGTPFSEPYVYGLPELRTANGTQRERLRGAKRIAVAGCNVTAVTLGLQPLVSQGLINLEDLVAVLAVGYSGAGKSMKPHLLALNAFENAKAYSVGGTHRHIPEIKQNIRKMCQTIDVHPKINFTPILVPMAQGILANISAKPNSAMSETELRQIFQEHYEAEAFVQVLRQGQPAEVAAVRDSNYAQIQTVLDEDNGRLNIIVALDNLVRGTAGQAIQSMNIALGLQETTALL
ncbi:MAG: N-acetyl-gamma-glutamyl-phosphate reductase [Candidatus Ancillula sp.]|jgi:N-acetyl-gamma-glutamyl-phosphate reductase|nr:N-acetyl-gamma-glutamyl-phosphate reductase [Candidatus Ancillula sp.]